MSFVHDPNQLRETVQHQVEAVVHQADGLLHSPRKTTRYSQTLLHHQLSTYVITSCPDPVCQRAALWVLMGGSCVGTAADTQQV